MMAFDPQEPPGNALGRRLKALRESQPQRITRTAAAAWLRLSPKTGHRTVLNWEEGTVIPRNGHRRAFLRYLWCGLGLRARPRELDELWTLVEAAWHWPPLVDTDWAMLEQLDCAGAALEPNRQRAPTRRRRPAAPPDAHHVSPAARDAKAPRAATPALVAQPETGRATAPPSAKPIAHRHQPLLLGLVGLVLLALLLVMLWPRQATEATPLLRPQNLGFETGALAPWSVAGNPRCARVEVDGASIHGGRHILQVDTGRARCSALHYELAGALAQGDMVRIAFYLRSAEPRLQAVYATLTPGDQQPPAVGNDEDDLSVVESGRWQCIERAWVIDAETVDRFRIALHFPTHQHTHIHMDGAEVRVNGGRICEADEPHVVDGDFEQSGELLAWRVSTEECRWEIVEGGAGALSGNSFLRIVRQSPACRELSQHVAASLPPGATVRARAWLRAANAGLQSASWRLQAETTPALVSNQPAWVEKDRWRCVESLLTAPARGLAGLRVTLALEGAPGVYDMDDVVLALSDERLCPPQELLANAGFEAGDSLLPWGVLGNCAVTLRHDAPRARTGRRYAEIVKHAGCSSLYQDIEEPIAPGDTRTLSLWVRSPDAPVAHGRLALWAIGVQQEQRYLDFALEANGWSCLETTLPAARADHRHWRAELYFYADGAAYHVDNASLVEGPNGACPETSYVTRAFGPIPHTLLHPGETFSGLLVVENTSGLPVERRHQLQVWVANEPYGPPISAEPTTLVDVPPLAAGQVSRPLYFDIRLPRALSADQPYFLVHEFASFRANLDDMRASRQSRRIDIQPCAVGAFYCDIADGFWAQREVEALHAAGITTGCRTDVKPYEGLPFCPQQLLWLDYLAVFLLRHHHGAGYQPAAAYRGFFEDVPATHQRALWLEELYERLGRLERANCRSAADSQRACLEMPMLRRDLLRYLAAYLQIEPLPVGRHYVDLVDDLALNALVEHFRQRGILPDPDPHCPAHASGPRFCPDEPARRVDAAVWMARAFGLIDVAARVE